MRYSFILPLLVALTGFEIVSVSAAPLPYASIAGPIPSHSGVLRRSPVREHVLAVVFDHVNLPSQQERFMASFLAVADTGRLG